MTFVSIRDMRTRPGEVWQQLQQEGDLIVTSSGRPFALMISAEGEDVEELLLALRRARAQLAVSRMRKQASSAGLEHLLLDEINAEIRQARAKRPELKLNLPDPTDTVFVEVAAAAEAPLVTGNGRHFPPDGCAGIVILRAGVDVRVPQPRHAPHG